MQEKVKVEVIKFTELDAFSKEYHKKEGVPRWIQTYGSKLQEHWIWEKKTAKVPDRGIMTNPHSPLRGLKSIEFNPTELCNRTCHFCPRVDPEVYPNRKLHMQPETVQRVVDELITYEYNGQIMFSGMGEPTLNRKICELIKICSDAGFYTEMTSNGDKIFQDKWYSMQDFVDAGLHALHLDVYDDTEQLMNYIEMVKPYQDKIRLKLTPRFLVPTGIFNNRAGDVHHADVSTVGTKRPCMAPSVKAFIDWDGTVQLCCHDWQRAGGNFGNVNQQLFTDIWNGKKMLKVRGKLMYNNRTECGTPCNGCNTGGNVHDSKEAMHAWSKLIWPQ